MDKRNAESWRSGATTLWLEGPGAELGWLPGQPADPGAADGSVTGARTAPSPAFSAWLPAEEAGVSADTAAEAAATDSARTPAPRDALSTTPPGTAQAGSAAQADLRADLAAFRTAGEAAAPGPAGTAAARDLPALKAILAGAAGPAPAESEETASAFQYGVASGDPDAESVVLWTHARPEGVQDGDKVVVFWQVATDAGFQNVVDRGLGLTSAAQDYTFKAIADGLEPGGEYFYRFRVAGEWSETGQTRTLPGDGLDALKLAVFSCVNYPAGFFNAFDAAVRDGFDFAVHLGDYIYEYGEGEYATDTAAELGRLPIPANELLTYADYSARYAQYHTDADLQALRKAAPAIMMWDDHETANDSWETGAQNHDPATEGDWEARRDAALEAFFRWNPLREPESGDLRDHDKSYDFGTLASLHMLETRLQARDETEGDILSATGSKILEDYAAAPAQFLKDAFAQGLSAAEILDGLAADPLFFALEIATGALVAAARDPDREMIGAAQMAELVERIEASDAAWQIIGSQTLMARMELPLPLLFDLTFTYIPLLAQEAAGQPLTPEQEAVLAELNDAKKVPYNLDSWDGYQAERETILQTLAGNGSPAIVISGDTHNAWFSEIRTEAGALAAYEFGGPGVTSPGLEGVFPEFLDETGAPIDYIGDAFVEYIDTLFYANARDRGYMSVNLTRDAVTTDYVFVDTTQSRDYQTATHSETVLASAFADAFDLVA